MSPAASSRCSLPSTAAVVALWRARPGAGTGLPPALVCAWEMPAEAHLDMQAALQPHVDNAISKTINLPADATFEACEGVFRAAWDKGLKGCTLYRRGAAEAVLAGHCAAMGCRLDG
jgi:ribonucleoside-diphosphate reductase alpha chain